MHGFAQRVCTVIYNIYSVESFPGGGYPKGVGGGDEAAGRTSASQTHLLCAQTKCQAVCHLLEKLLRPFFTCSGHLHLSVWAKTQGLKKVKGKPAHLRVQQDRKSSVFLSLEHCDKRARHPSPDQALIYNELNSYCGINWTSSFITAHWMLFKLMLRYLLLKVILLFVTVLNIRTPLKGFPATITCNGLYHQLIKAMLINVAILRTAGMNKGNVKGVSSNSFSTNEQKKFWHAHQTAHIVIAHQLAAIHCFNAKLKH